jgi:MoaA/NifB/PqqE/SkfB family radical SAM enzyme
MSPQKLPPTDEQKKEKVRQEGRKGIITMSYAQKGELGRDMLIEIWELAEFQIFKTWEDEKVGTCFYCGYCPMFSATERSERIPYYTMRVTFEPGKRDPTIEMFRRRN